MLPVLKVQEGPELTISFQDDVSAAPTVAAIRTAMLNKFLPVKMKVSGAPISRPRAELYVIDEIGR